MWYKIIKALQFLQHFLNHKYAFPHKTGTCFFVELSLSTAECQVSVKVLKANYLCFLSSFLPSFGKKK